MKQEQIKRMEKKSIRKEDYKKRYRDKWIKGFIENNNRNPTDDEFKSWNYGFTAGYKARKKRIFAQLGENNEEFEEDWNRRRSQINKFTPSV